MQKIKAYIRIRPFLNSQNQNKIIFQSDQQRIIIYSPYNFKNKSIYCYDYVFQHTSSQSQVYSISCSKIIQQSIQGYNSTIFVYGQTSNKIQLASGKTFTMLGQKNDGIICNTVCHILSLINKSQNKKFMIMTSFVELYKQKLTDMITLKQVSIRESRIEGFYLQGAQKEIISNMKKFKDSFNKAVKIRKIAATQLNSHSSRSHFIVSIHIESYEYQGQDKVIIKSKINLVDLAGSQNFKNVDKENIEQSKMINLSLSCLAHVIRSLVDERIKHIPYRDSKLTMILKNSLGGNSKTLMIGTISPSIDNYEESLNTLRYASKIKYIRNNPQINKSEKNSLISYYEGEINRLKGLLQKKNMNKNTGVDLKQFQKMKQELHQIQNLILQKNSFKDTYQYQQLLQQINFFQQQNRNLMVSNNIKQTRLNILNSNYSNLYQQIDQMRYIITQLRRKYIIAAQQIDEKQNQYQNEVNYLKSQVAFYKNKAQYYKSINKKYQSKNYSIQSSSQINKQQKFKQSLQDYFRNNKGNVFKSLKRLKHKK